MSQSSLRARAARSVLESVPLIMRTVGHGVRHGGGEVSPQQYRLLNIIGAHPQTPTRLAHIQGVTPATATATVSTLEQRGWVSREHDAGDRRRVIVSLTGEGRAVLDRARAIIEGAIADALQDLTDEELRTLVAGMDVLKAISVTRTDCI